MTGLTSAACPTSSPQEGRGSCSSGMGLSPEPFSRIVWCPGSLFQGIQSCRVMGKFTQEGKMIWVCVHRRGTPALLFVTAGLSWEISSLPYFSEGTLQSREGNAHPQEPGKSRPAPLLLAACPCLDLWYLLSVPGTKAGISEALL